MPFIPAGARAQAAVSLGVLATGLALAVGAVDIPSAAGYGGVGPNFLPWLVALGLIACGVLLLREALRGGFAGMPAPEHPRAGGWPGFLWVSSAILVNAALITTLGFVLACALCFLLASQGLRRTEGQSPAARDWMVDAVGGLALSAPVFWLFTGVLGISLPALIPGGWL